MAFRVHELRTPRLLRAWNDSIHPRPDAPEERPVLRRREERLDRPPIGRLRPLRRLIGLQTACELYRVVRFYVNFFQPSMKLTTKTRDGSQVTKRYDIAQTPYQRLSNSDALDPEVRDRLAAIYERSDPGDLLRQLEKRQDAFWRHAKETGLSRANGRHRARRPCVPELRRRCKPSPD